MQNDDGCFFMFFNVVLLVGPIPKDARQKNMNCGGTQTSRSFTRTGLVTKTMDGLTPQMSIQFILISLLAVPRQYHVASDLVVDVRIYYHVAANMVLHLLIYRQVAS